VSDSYLIHPISYQAFESEDEQMDQAKQWGLLSEKAARLKTFYYKSGGVSRSCTLIGYVDQMTAVIAFEDGQKHCIHPSYLKEMQAASYGQKQSASAAALAADPSLGNREETAPAEVTGVSASSSVTTPAETAASNNVGNAQIEQQPLDDPSLPPWDITPTTDTASATTLDNRSESKAAPAKSKEKKPKATKLQLPEGKVTMTAVVKEFTTVPNHFADADDEVIVYESVVIVEPEHLEVGDAWSSLSATLKKFELEEGDTLRFDCKIVAKKLTRHPVPYKINNPAKIQKNPEQ